MFKSDVKVILVLGETPGESEEVELERKKLKVVNIDLSRDAPPWHLYAISDYSKMIRVFSWILRFVNNCTLFNGKCKDSELSQSEIENSEKKLIRLVQSYYLPDAKSSNYIETYIDDEVKSLSSEPTPLPPDRVTDCAPFEIVGIDFAGPLFLKDGRKVWITLFTCAVYRAIHLELVNSLTSDAFLLALRCFIARRGRPRTIYCDNGTNFRGAFNDLSKLNWSKIVEETRTPKILWKFIPPTAAWWGGWGKGWVRTVKDCFFLKRTLGRSVLKYDELYTVLCDCESIINCRPLTYVSENSEEFIPLTPSMFLISNKNSNIEDIEELNSNSLNKRIKYRRRDGKIRTVRLKTQHGKMLRPIQRIYPLEIRSNENLQRGMEESIPTVSETLSADEIREFIVFYLRWMIGKKGYKPQHLKTTYCEEILFLQSGDKWRLSYSCCAGRRKKSPTSIPEENTSMLYSGFESEPTRLQAESHIHHKRWVARLCTSKADIRQCIQTPPINENHEKDI
ncbi:integrase catalytic domain-containing protein [Trichonephila clavipes]|nr:integrase catalytic domain-containing protein [Trichonephila clavipes]